MNVVSLFAGAGGMDLGFGKAGFRVNWANEFDKTIWETFERNHPNTTLDKRSIRNIPEHEIPDCDGIIGGPPCQSWSIAGKQKGMDDPRGQLFHEFVRVVKAKQPKFFVAENVTGILAKKHAEAFEDIKDALRDCGYSLSVNTVNAADYGVPQDRKRVFFVGYRVDLNLTFKMPEPSTPNPFTLEHAIVDLKETPMPALPKNHSKKDACLIPNHEYIQGSFSPFFNSANRVRPWHRPSFTIVARGSSAPIHPQAPAMVRTKAGGHQFVKGKESLYRRLTVRECARIQTFPDDFTFYYKHIADGYKMVGNAVPVNLAYAIAQKISYDLSGIAKEK